MDPLSLVPVHFEQLKELRNGSISYIQIIKRDQTRPPVRPVCRKLGVSKLSDIKSEGDLYNALLSVAQGQTIKAQTPPYDSLKSGLFALNTDPVPRSSRFSNDGPYSPYSPLSVGPSSAPDFDQVLECVLYIQLHWDPRDCSQSLSTFAFRFGLDESYLLTVLQRVCGILGCAHLTPHIDTTMVVDATKICFKQLELLHRSCVTDSPAISERNSPRL